MNKTLAVLHIYELLLRGEQFNVSDIIVKYNCSERTAQRYIYTIKKYLKEFKNDTKLVYHPQTRSYKFVTTN